MKPFSKCYYLNACGLLLAGLIVTGISVGAGAWNAEKYGEALHLKDRYFEVTEPFTSMQLISNTANVVVNQGYSRRRQALHQRCSRTSQMVSVFSNGCQSSHFHHYAFPADECL